MGKEAISTLDIPMWFINGHLIMCFVARPTRDVDMVSDKTLFQTLQLLILLVEKSKKSL